MPGKKGFGDSRTTSSTPPTYKLEAENPDTGMPGGRVAKKLGSPAKSTGYAPFKMKGSPMYRNFGIGSPAKNTGEDPHFHQRLNADNSYRITQHDGDGEIVGEFNRNEPREDAVPDKPREEEKGMMKTGSPATKRDHTNPLYDIPVIKAGSPAKGLGGAKGKGEMKPQKYKPR
jgi:hypothetical protein|tara:strand:- start:536 stop:1054 length:519 start_codon:yes stop_codon:yes gene_type:complete